MSEAKHTKGPWNYDGADGEYVTPPNLDEPVICDLMPRDADCFTEEDEANGHLIAAAPDLLAGCERLITNLDNGRPLTGAFLNIRAAIKKAKGE